MRAKVRLRLRTRQASTYVRAVNPALVLALVIVAGLAATFLPRDTLDRLHLRFVPPGVPLLLLGVLLGPLGGAFDEGVRHALAPVMAFVIGWTGASFGARLDWRLLRRIPRSTWIGAGLRAGAAYLAVGAAAVALALAIPELRAAWRPLTVAALALAAVAAVSAGTGTIATLETAFGAIAFTLALAIGHPWN